MATLSLFVSGIILALIQLVAALPWLWAFDPSAFRAQIRRRETLLTILGAILGVGAFLGWYISTRAESSLLQSFGQYYGALLHLQLAVDGMILLPQLLLLVWPKGGAVALAAYREGWRQPMFWLIVVFAVGLIFLSIVVPYFTFGDDYKMMKQLSFDTVMLSAVLFGVLAGAISINEEIEGRTAITVMSKPVTRRHFLIGKYGGLCLSTLAMTLILGWVLNWALGIKANFDKLDEVNDTMPQEVAAAFRSYTDKSLPSPLGSEVLNGTATWFGEAAAHHIGLALGFGQVMVLVAIAAALATRLPFVVNVVICLVIFFLGHLAPVLVDVTQKQAGDALTVQLVGFIAQIFNVLLPALEFFNMGPAIIRDNPLNAKQFAVYVLTVLGYAVMYTGIALLLGLILFEDRDLA